MSYDKTGKNLGGRPTKYREEFCEAAIALMKDGASITEVAAECDVEKKNLYIWMEKHPKFRHAIKKGVRLSEAWWEMKGRKGVDTKEFNSTLWYMNMKNRFRWNDSKPTYRTYDIPGYEGSINNRAKALTNAVKSQIIPVDVQTCGMRALSEEAHILEKTEMFDKLEEVMGVLGLKDNKGK